MACYPACVKQDYDIVLPLMAAAGVSSLVVELLSLPDGETMTPTPPPMPRDMSLEIGLKTSKKVDELMGKVQVTAKFAAVFYYNIYIYM